MELDCYWHIVIIETDIVKELIVDKFELKKRYDFRAYSEEEYLKSNDDEKILWIFAAKRGQHIDANIDCIDWNKTKQRLLRNASAIPREWFAANSYVHEIALWIDGTVINAFHPQCVGV